MVLLVERSQEAVLDLAAGYGGIDPHCALDYPCILLYSHLFVQEALLHKGTRFNIDTSADERANYYSIIAYGSAVCRTGGYYALLHPRST